MFAGNFAPGGSSFCSGSLLPISQNEALFSKLETTYGGDGQTTFALPDLDGLIPTGAGQGTGLTNRNLGIATGSSTVTLSTANLPASVGGSAQSFNNVQPSLPLTYMIAVEGEFPSTTQGGGGGAQTPLLGQVILYAGLNTSGTLPSDFLPCSGQLLPISQNEALFAILGNTYGGDGNTTFALPDLRGRTTIGTGQGSGLTARTLGSAAGAESTTLNTSNLPSPAGADQPYNNMQPSLPLNYIIALEGIFPQTGGGSVDNPEPFLGQISLFAGNFAPYGWALCSGQILSITQNEALFNVLGTEYGGNGQTTFALPNLQGRAGVGVETGSGLNGNMSYPLGSLSGSESLQLTVATTPQLLSQVSSAWNVSSGASWLTSSSWTTSIPNFSGATATLGPKLTTSGNITLDAAITIGHLAFNSASASYTVSAGAGGTLTLNNTAPGATGSPDITVLAGSHIISAPLILSAGVTTNTSTGTSLTISSAITGTGPLTVSGLGALKLAGIDTFTGGTTVTGGTLEVTSSGSLLSTAPLNISGGTVTFDASTSTGILQRSIGNVTLSTATSLTVTQAANHSNRTLFTAASLSITGSPNAYTAKLDLTNNDLDLKAGSLSTITNYIAGGYNTSAGGIWKGQGITSSTAAANSIHLTALGVIQNNQSGKALFTASNTFDGATPGTSDILVKYTYYGDANLDGKIDGSDYSQIDNGYVNHLTSWYNGDFNYDGVIDGSDYTLIDNAFNNQGASQSASISASVTAQISAVPEPASLGLMALSAVSLLTRCSRLQHPAELCC